jgi:hypothetical protein
LAEVSAPPVVIMYIHKYRLRHNRATRYGTIAMKSLGCHTGSVDVPHYGGRAAAAAGQSAETLSKQLDDASRGQPATLSLLAA